MIRVTCEWDMGLPEFYKSEDEARQEYSEAFVEQDMDITMEEAEDENLIAFEEVVVV